MPLNNYLFSCLDRCFSVVKVSNAGQRMIATDTESIFAETNKYGRRSNQFRRTRPHLDIVQAGEFYLVCCPYCNDTRYRLYVSHMYGKKANSGRVLNFLAICYNEGCMQDEAHQEDFRSLLRAGEEDLERARVKPGRIVPPGSVTAEWPGKCVPLDKLSANHEARRYVESRRFDPDRLARVYGVRYCVDSLNFIACHRLIVPVYWDGKMAGWQARYVGELNWKAKGEEKRGMPPKYFTMKDMARGGVLANLDNARLFHTGVLVEGWFDVFGFGPMAVPVMGNVVTDQQVRLFADAFGKPDRAGVVLLDPEEHHTITTERTVRILREKLSGRLANVRLPAGKDPGNLDRAFLRDYVRAEAAEQGVEVKWERVE